MRHHSVVAALMLAGSIFTPAVLAVPVAADGGSRSIPRGGTAQLVSRPNGPEGGVAEREFAREPEAAREGAAGQDIKLRNTAPTTGSAPDVVAQVFNTSPTIGLNFEGLNHRNQRLANGGNQFSLEPPDQGLCVGGNFILESVNDVMRVYNRTTGAPLTGVLDLNTFYGYPAQFNRTTGAQGPFVTDPECLFDEPTQRWFHTVLTLDVFPDTGDFTGSNHIDIAVSRTADPRGEWAIYRLDVTDDGQNGTPNHGCPPGPPPPPPGHPPTRPNACIGDFPHIGADKHAFVVTTNEYCLFCPPTPANPTGFHAAQVYAFDKAALARNDATIAVSQIDTIGMDRGRPGFTLWPAISPGTDQFELSHGGTEYFTSSNAAEEVSNVPNSRGTNRSNEILVWALTNTASVKGSTPNLRLRNSPVIVTAYSVPGPSNQKPGPFPLGQCINDTTSPTPFGPGCWRNIFVTEPAHDEVEGPLDSSDSRVLSTKFVRGHLLGTLDTNVNVGGKTKAGVLYYMISPRLGPLGSVTGSLVRDGILAVPNNNVIYGAVAATRTGKAVVAFTLVGDDLYPSAGYVSLNGAAELADMRLIFEGVAPQDGFSEYKAFSAPDPPRPRWGDYGAAVAFDDNTIYVASEAIHSNCTLAQYMAAPFGSCGGTRTALANWSTHVTQLIVGP